MLPGFNNNENNNGSVGFLGLLGIAFIVLKLTEVIDWSWIWVLAPLWGGYVVSGILFLVIWAVSKYKNF